MAVMLSRQQDALVIIGDRRCVDEIPFQKGDKTGQKYSETMMKHNAHLKRMFDWLIKNKGLYQIEVPTLSQDQGNSGGASSGGWDNASAGDSGGAGSGWNDNNTGGGGGNSGEW